MTSWDEVRPTLKPFQVASVDAAFDALWHDATTSRFLVADEVGLGKTLVAKGVIARTIDELRGRGDERVDIVYICSNTAIAQQNLRKFREFADGDATSADRLTKIIAARGLRRKGVNVIALTPGTSFTFGHRSGQFPERALIYAALQRIWGDKSGVLRTHGAKRLFYYGVNEDSFAAAGRRLVDAAAEWDARISAPATQIMRRLITERNKQLRADGHKNLWDQIRFLVPAFNKRSGPTYIEWEERQRLVGELRQLMAQAGIALLRPDLVIMDEFQRFAELLDPDATSRAAGMLRQFISSTHGDNTAPTKVLLLSATPYRWFDRSGDGSHHSDFLSTLRFLHNGDASKVERAEDALRRLREALLLRDRDAATEAATAASNELRRVMTRTERLSSTPDRNGMLRDQPVETPVVVEDIEGFVSAQRLGDQLGSPSVVELWKTSPWLANMGDGYKLTDRLGERARDDPEFVWGDATLLDIGAVARFGTLSVPNPRLRWMIERTIGHDWHRLLWLPPLRPYYETHNLFDQCRAAGMTKQLVFSSWRVAPKAIALGLTYAAEESLRDENQQSVKGEPDQDASPAAETVEEELDGWSGTEYRSHDRRLLELSLRDDKADSLTNFLLAVPFSGLAALVDPLELGLASDGSLRSFADVRSDAVTIVASSLAGVGIEPGNGQILGAWYAYAARLLSRDDDGWWRKVGPAAFMGAAASNRSKALGQHIAEVRELVPPAGEPPSDIVEVLTDVAIASPAVCALRSMRRILGAPSMSDSRLLDAAATTGWGFRSLFDTPEVINVVQSWRLHSDRDVASYWRQVLLYSAEGNLQAVLDEYLHMLREWMLGGRRGVDEAASLAGAAAEALAFRTVTLSTRVPRSDDTGMQTRMMRSRFAVRFGDKASDDDDERKTSASAAFNSPFWPFVMATTSIGQEGLDFHLYSHALVHWNLPSDPVSLEQREGRVHRYKGHAVRKNVAEKYKRIAVAAGGDPWDEMFAAATPPGSDGIEPFWVCQGDAAVERIIPMLPMSREHSQIEYLKDAAARYRMAFGQPRHDDLLDALDDGIDLPAIDLAPM